MQTFLKSDNCLFFSDFKKFQSEKKRLADAQE